MTSPSYLLQVLAWLVPQCEQHFFSLGLVAAGVGLVGTQAGLSRVVLAEVSSFADWQLLLADWGRLGAF